MYEDSVEPCNFDPNFKPLPPPPPPPPQPSMEEELPNELLGGLGFNMETNWDNNIHGLHGGTTSTTTTSPYTPTPDLRSIFNSSSIAFTNPHFPSSFGYLEEFPGGAYNPSGTTSSSVLYDPRFHFNVPPPLMFTAELPHESYSLPASRNGRGGGRCVKGSPRCSDRDKRTQLNAMYNALRKLVPNPTTKGDRASIVGDAIDYIKELRRTVDELRLLVERKRCGREGIKRPKTNETTDGGGTGGDDERCNMKLLGSGGLHDQSDNNGSLRSSWLQRKSKDTEVDVRIIDDEVTIKLVQKKINVLLFVSKLLDELQLDVLHIAGGHIGNSYSFLFNTKMYEGSSLYASAIAQKLIEVLNRCSSFTYQLIEA